LEAREGWSGPMHDRNDRNDRSERRTTRSHGRWPMMRWCGVAATMLLLATTACAEPEGLLLALPAKTTVKFDFDHRPLPDIPLPNDIATRPDATSLTGLRVNASMLASTRMEETVRTLIDTLDGW